MAMITDALNRSFDRIDDFLAVQGDERGRVTVDAVLRLQESVGIEDGERALVAERLERLRSQTAAGSFLLGVIVGLAAADLAEDPRPPR